MILRSLLVVATPYRVCPVGYDVLSVWDVFEPPEEGRGVEFPQQIAILADCTTITIRETHAIFRFSRKTPTWYSFSYAYEYMSFPKNTAIYCMTPWCVSVYPCLYVYTSFPKQISQPLTCVFYMYKSVSQKKITFLWDLHVNTSITQDIMCVCTFSFYVYTNFAQGIAW